LIGCEEKFPVYTAFSEQNVTDVGCLHYATMNVHDQKHIELALKRPHMKECSYHLHLIKYHVGECNNSVVKSLGSDFDGYIRIEVRKGFNVFYKVQSDFKNDSNAAFERVLKQMAKDIGH